MAEESPSKGEIELKREERFYDLTKYLASTSLTLLGVLIAVKQAKWIDQAKLESVFHPMLFVLVINFGVLFYTSIYLTNNGSSKRVERAIILSGCFVVSIVCYIVMKLA